MSDVTTSTGGDDGRRGRRPILHPGKVTKKKGNLANDESAITEEPPQWKGKKIGGARNILQKNELAAAGTDVDEPTRDISDIAALQIPSETAGPQLGPRNLQDLAVQPGWRRFWIPLTEHQSAEWNKMPDVKISRFCLSCWQTHETERCYESSLYTMKSNRMLQCFTCCESGEDCQFMVSYRIYSDEDQALSFKRHPTMREIAGHWEAAQGTPLAIATRTEATELQPQLRLPLDPWFTVADQPNRPAPSTGLWPVAAKEDHKKTRSKSNNSLSFFDIYDASSRPFWESHTCHTMPYRHYDLDPRFYKGPLPFDMKRMKDDNKGKEKRDQSNAAKRSAIRVARIFIMSSVFSL